MKLTYYGYNGFVIEGKGKTVILDPGQDLYWRRLDSLIPRSLWPQANLILVTHGDADHAEYVVQVAEASGAPVVCSPPLAERWRRKGVTVVPIAPGQTVEAAEVPVQGVAVRHGPLLNLFGRSLTLKAGEDSVGLLFTLDERRLLILGDTMLLEDAWRGLRPDVLLVPIGGVMTMNVDQALQAVAAIEPQVVIPVHYNWHALFYRHPADVKRFSASVRQIGSICLPLVRGETAEL